MSKRTSSSSAGGAKRFVLTPRRVPVDEKGWPRSFWKLFGQLPSDFDLGNRGETEERASPLED